jgi:hypothetical protein
MKEIFEKIYIKSEADLPKKAGNYWAKTKSYGSITYEGFDRSQTGLLYWESEVEYYLQPLSGTELIVPNANIEFYEEIEYMQNLYKKNKNSSTHKNVIENFCILYQKQNKFDKALKYCDRLYLLAKETNDKEYELVSYRNFISIYNKIPIKKKEYWDRAF